MFDSEVRAIWLFFYLVTLDENMAIAGASKATDIFFQIMKRKPQTHPHVAAIQVMDQTSHEIFLSKIKTQDFRFQGIDLTNWVELRSRISPVQFYTLIWSQVLKYSFEDISVAIGATEGTISYRVSEAVRALGQILPGARIVKGKI